MKKFLIKFLALFIKDKEKRKLWRKNHLIPDCIHLLCNSYIINPFFGSLTDIKIGKYVSIARNVTIGPDNHPTNLLSTSPFSYKRKLNSLKPNSVQIGHDVWIGTNVTILKGVHISTGTVVGAGAVCTHDTPPYSIVAGVPARVIKYRFNEELIQKILNSKWWDLPKAIVEKLPVENVEECCKIASRYLKNMKK